MASLSFAVAALTAALLVSPAAPQGSPPPARLLADLNDTPQIGASSNPTEFTTAGGITFFAAEDGVHGIELWRTLGTAATTAMVKDLRPGTMNSIPRDLTAVGGRLFFTAYDEMRGRELWTSDGTEVGTQLVTEIVPGAGGIVIGERVALDGRLVFDVTEPIGGTEPWVSDGTAAGTMRLADIEPGPGASRYSFPVGFMVVRPTVIGDEVLFTAVRNYRLELWRTDGTPAGTFFRTDAFHAAGSSFSAPVVLDHGVIVLAAQTGQVPFSSVVLWRTDGTSAGTFPLLWSLPTRTQFGPPKRFDGKAWFPADGSSMSVVSDGTVAGSRVVPLTGGGAPQLQPYFLGELDGALWAVAALSSANAVVYGIERGANAWRRDGELPFAVFTPSPYSASGFAARVGPRFVLIGGSGRSGCYGFDPRTMTAQFLAGVQGIPARGLVTSLGRVYLAGWSELGIEPWLTDGTPLGTRLVKDIRSGTPGPATYDSWPDGFVRAGARTVFRAQLADGDAVLASDGTANGTVTLARGLGAVQPVMIPEGSRVFFAAETAATGTELWVCDGGLSPARLVADLRPGSESGVVALLGELRGEVFFIGGDGQSAGLFASDGTNLRFIATMPVDDELAPFQSLRLGERIAIVVPWQRYSANELWTTDGTSSGTQLIFRSLNVSVVPASTNLWRGKLWFTHVFPQLPEIWVFATDGSVVGTVQVASIVPAPTVSRFVQIVPSADRLWVFGSAGLWYLDDPARGFVSAAIPSGYQVAPPFSVIALGNRLLFDVALGNQRHLASHDGTTNGFELLSLRPRGAFASRELARIGERFVLFPIDATTPAARELWITDGRATGTRLFQSVSPALGWGGAPWRYVPRHVDGKVWLPVLDPQFGVEPYVLDGIATSERIGNPCGSVNRDVELRAITDPVLGVRCELRGFASAGSVAVPLLGLAPPTPLRMPMTAACVLETGADFVALPAVPIQAGSFTVGLAVPDAPFLAGMQVVVQPAVGPTDAPLGADLGNGVLLTLGR
ncbi:MAG: hypothetical protein HZB39_16945 [Planctomycetes bacterium]|nr:hypothetical protein [Planctomycetota bacterium]